MISETAGGGSAGRPFDLLLEVFGDPETASLLSREDVVESWLAAERALAAAQAEVGVIGAAEAEAIQTGAVAACVDGNFLWDSTRLIGYPILPLVGMVAGSLPDGPNGRVHYGATTQDIMDTGLILQLRRVRKRLLALLIDLGDAVAALVEEHDLTLMAARTHNQQAVPTTLGATLASFLAELVRHRERFCELAERLEVVSLYGAGGTGAGLGAEVRNVRRAFARRLGLGSAEIPWHATRDCLAEFGTVCMMVSATAARLSNNVINLARTEIAEVIEGDGEYYGASSTMPQKHNPIRSEVVVGMSIVANGLAASLGRVMVVPHERAAGEWQAEWYVVPQLAALAAGALWNCSEMARHLTVRREVMLRNLGSDGGRSLAEGFMMGLAEGMGREAAHRLVYNAVRGGGDVAESIRRLVPDGYSELFEEVVRNTRYDSYVGEAKEICEEALAYWRRSRSRDHEETA